MGAFGGSWEYFCSLFSRSLEKLLKCKNDQPSITFGVFFGGWGLLWRVLEAVLGGFWELFWKMLAPRWCFFGYLGRCCGILVPRWRTGAPRRGKIGELRRQGFLLGVGIHARAREEPPCNPLRMDSPEWVSRLRLQLELDLEN